MIFLGWPATSSSNLLLKQKWLVQTGHFRLKVISSGNWRDLIIDVQKEFMCVKFYSGGGKTVMG